MTNSSSNYDVVVVGAGVFGAWTAWHLARRRRRVLLVDAYGPAHARASSGGESRIIRMGYGADEIYTRWALRSLGQWKEFFTAVQQPLFHQTGVLWLAGENDTYLKQSQETLWRCGLSIEHMDRSALERRFPQFSFEGVTAGFLEPQSGVLMARRAVVAVVQDAVRHGVQYRAAAFEPPRGSSRLDAIATTSGDQFSAGAYVFACGAWLGKLFPEVLSSRIFPSRQEVYYFGVPRGDLRFAPPAMPTWLFQADEVYGMPDLEGRGVKIAVDHHGERVDPDTLSRIVSAQSAERMRAYMAKRFPALQNAPVVETRVCQYENTWNGDFLIDRHPRHANLWFAGGGSGHGFKHGPALGEYLAKQILGEGAAPEPRFSLATKLTVQKRAVF